MTDKIIIHGFPSAGLEHIYRNPRYEIKRFLEHYHKDHYKVFNFCCEPGRGYDPSVFEGRVERYPFKDHNTPPLETMAAFANSCKAWIEDDPLNVCSMHCKAGKGRAGLMCCVLMVRTGAVSSAKAAFEKYDKERVTNGKGLTVTSQRKFVVFYEQLWRQYWNVQGDIGEELADREGAEKRFIVPSQPELCITGVEILNIETDKWKGLVVKAYKGTNFKPELLFETTKSNSLLFPFNCKIQGNFKIRVEQPGCLKTLCLMELWHNTLFMERC